MQYTQTQTSNSFLKILKYKSKFSFIFMRKFLAYSWKACQQGKNILVDI